MNRDALDALFENDTLRDDAFGLFGLSGRARRRLQAARPAEGPSFPPGYLDSSVSGKPCIQT